MADTLDDLLEQWKIHGGWKPSKADFQRLVDEIERLRNPPADQQVDLVKAWGWTRVANFHDADPDRDGAEVKRCHHLDVDWCSQRDKGRMIPVLRPPIGATDA